MKKKYKEPVSEPLGKKIRSRSRLGLEKNKEPEPPKKLAGSPALA